MSTGGRRRQATVTLTDETEAMSRLLRKKGVNISGLHRDAVYDAIQSGKYGITRTEIDLELIQMRREDVEEDES